MTLSKYDRFDLEQAIMVAWNTCEDIDLIYHNTDNLNLNAKDCDNLQNQLLGLKHITELRFEKMWHIFEELIRRQKLEVSSDPSYDTIDEEYMSMLNDIDKIKI
jgi:hypothetical protein|tara:strand:- start:276 stop:587 length:312 start_codon:yes stop_codon:yes gene_type:complete